MTPRPEPTGVGGAAREATQSLQLSLPPEEVARLREEPSHPSIALGTHDQPGDLDGLPRDERTRVESPNARVRTPLPARAPSQHSRPPPLPRGGEDGDHVGSVLGSYKVIELLGKGGMGYVFRAEHVKLGREVALKLLRADYAKRRDAVLRFFQEAKTVNRVRHRNIVDVTDFVELPDGTTFIIMELLSGQSLGKWARTGIDLPRALAVLVQICDGLAAAHHVGVVHRDLKPDNIIVVPTTDGAELVKLLDFGVAKLLNRDDEDVGFQTAAGSVIGTPAYMSPEQAGGMTIDARSDIYSLGAIMYELFCGQPMFRGRSFGEYVRKHLTEMPVPPRATPAGAQMDPRLEQLILCCLQKEPAQRFGQIGELREALLGLLAGMDVPPQLATLSASAMRPMPTMPGSSGSPMPLAAQTILPAILPLGPQPLFAPSLGSQPSAVPHYDGSYSQVHPHAQSATYPPYAYVPQTGIQPASTPWWVWFVGGAAAVGLGIGAAVWYAHGTAPVAQTAQTAPVVKVASAEPIEPMPVKPVPLEVKFDSLPSGSVFADGKSAELCHTPCSFVIDPNDGDSLEARTFLVKAEGYRDAAVQVDLRAPQRDFHVSLLKLEPAIVPVPVPVPDPVVIKSDGGKKRPHKPTTDTNGTGLIDPGSAGTASHKKHGGKDHGIDPSQTIDPFKKK